MGVDGVEHIVPHGPVVLLGQTLLAIGRKSTLLTDLSGRTVVADDIGREMLRSRGRIIGAKHQLAVFDVGLEEDSPWFFGLTVPVASSCTTGECGGQGGSERAVIEDVQLMMVVEGAVVVVDIHMSCKADLLLVGEAGGRARFRARPGEDRKQNSGQNGDNGDDNEQFDERKAAPAGGLGVRGPQAFRVGCIDEILSWEVSLHRMNNNRTIESCHDYEKRVTS